jgi:hypothetical protein
MRRKKAKEWAKAGTRLKSQVVCVHDTIHANMAAALLMKNAGIQ